MTASHMPAEFLLRERYNAAVNAITRPDRMVFCSQYLIDRWLPELGGDGLAILLYLRRRCYYNRKTGEKRDTCNVTLKDIADACQISTSTVKRQFASNVALQRFISWQEEFTVEPKRQGLRQSANTYTVLMDDPIHSADLEKLEALQTEDQYSQPECPKERARQREMATVAQHELPLQRQVNLSHRSDMVTLAQIEPPLVLTTPGQNEPPLQTTTVAQFDLLYKEVNHYLYESLQQQSHYPTASEKTVVALLCEQGVTPTIAGELVRDVSLDQIQKQLVALPYRNAKDKAAVLVKAIREGWAEPSAYVAAEKKRQREKQRAVHLQQTKEHEHDENTRKEKEDQEIEYYWNSLAPAERSLLEQEALEHLRLKNKILADRLIKNPQSGLAQNALNALRRDILLDRLHKRPSEQA